MDTDRMTGAELRVTREYLGLTGDWLARRLHVNPRTVRSWEQERDPIPAGIRAEVDQLARTTADTVAQLVDDLAGEADVVLVVYRDDHEYRAEHPGEPWPAAWHRAVVARVAQELPGLRIRYLRPEEK